jgi:hypothetical protein
VQITRHYLASLQIYRVSAWIQIAYSA